MGPSKLQEGHSLWGATPLERYRAAKNLDKATLSSIQRDLIEGCPDGEWPYGFATSINPWVLFVGPSPGASPGMADPNFEIRKGPPLPTAGTPHDGLFYQDSKNFFRKIRDFASNLIHLETDGRLQSNEALSLLGLINLDTGPSSKASAVILNASFASWALDVGIRRLKPKYVVGIGLNTLLNEARYKWLRDRLGEYTGSAFDPKNPEYCQSLKAYQERKYSFRGWSIRHGGLEGQQLIFLPQHPLRHPTTVQEVWACQAHEFHEFVHEAAWI